MPWSPLPRPIASTGFDQRLHPGQLSAGDAPAQLRVVIVAQERPVSSSLPSCTTPRACSLRTGSKT